jgi:hypothetical protein
MVMLAVAHQMEITIKSDRSLNFPLSRGYLGMIEPEGISRSLGAGLGRTTGNNGE